MTNAVGKRLLRGGLSRCRALGRPRCAAARDGPAGARHRSRAGRSGSPPNAGAWRQKKTPEESSGVNQPGRKTGRSAARPACAGGCRAGAGLVEASKATRLAEPCACSALATQCTGSIGPVVAGAGWLDALAGRAARRLSALAVGGSARPARQAHWPPSAHRGRAARLPGRVEAAAGDGRAAWPGVQEPRRLPGVKAGGRPESRGAGARATSGRAPS